MKNKNLIIGIVVVVIAVAGFFIYSNIQKQKLIEENQVLFDEFEALVISGDTSNCESDVDESLFPEISDLESLCYFNKGLDLYYQTDFINALVEFDESLSKSDKYTEEVNYLKSGIELLLNSMNSNLMLKLDIENENNFYHDMQSLIEEYPFEGSGEFLINNAFLPQILGYDTWSDGNKTLRFYNNTLYTDLPDMNVGNKEEIYFIPQTTYNDGIVDTDGFGDIMYETDDGGMYLAYLYKIVDLDTIIINVYYDNKEYIFTRGVK